MTPPSTSVPPGGKRPIRVMVVDDSAVIRGFISRTLSPDPDIDVAASVSNGEFAVRTIEREVIDVVVLDIEMPVMDGLTALPKILAASPATKVIMASTLTQRNASVSLEAMSKGAADYIPKPSSAAEIHSSQDFNRELLEKVKTLGAIAREARGGAPARPGAGAGTPAPSGGRAPAWATAVSAKPGQAKPVALRSTPLVRAEVVGIGSSTGGPQALFKVFEHLKTSVKLPILITQHMPPTFTSILAEHISKYVGGRCAEGKNGQAIEPGNVYLAPGGYHMVVAVENGRKVIRLNQDPPENFCRPAVDPMFRSLATAYGSRVLAVVLTGMGADGLNGGRAVVEAGGMVIAQDEATSVVWGMPGAVAMDGICSAVLPVGEIGPAISRVLTGVRP
jgi:two-component system chemotaxis response regulator CheB